MTGIRRCPGCHQVAVSARFVCNNCWRLLPRHIHDRLVMTGDLALSDPDREAALALAADHLAARDIAEDEPSPDDPDRARDIRIAEELGAL